MKALAFAFTRILLTLGDEDLSTAHLVGANLTGADLTGVILNGVHFNDTNQRRAVLTDAHLEGTGWGALAWRGPDRSHTGRSMLR